MKILFLLMASATAFAQVNTQPNCNIDRTFPKNQEFSRLNCESLNQRQANFLNRCVPQDKPDDAQVLVSVLTKEKFEEEAKILLRGTPLDTGDDRAVREFLRRVREAAKSTTDERIRGEIEKLASDSEAEWADMRVFDDDSAEETHLDMGAMRATLNYVLEQSIKSQEFIELTKQNGVNEMTALRLQKEELESIYSEYPEFRDLGKPNAYSVFAEVFRDLQVSSKMMAGNPPDRPECRQIWSRPVEDRIFCRTVFVRESIVNKLSLEMPNQDVRMKQLGARRDLRVTTDRRVQLIETEVSIYQMHAANLKDHSVYWRKLLRYFQQKGDRFGEAYAFKRMCEAQLNAVKNPPAALPTPGRGSGQP